MSSSLRFVDVGRAAFSSSVTVRRAVELLLDEDDDDGLEEEDVEGLDKDEEDEEEEGLEDDDKAPGGASDSPGAVFREDSTGSSTLAYSSSKKRSKAIKARKPIVRLTKRCIERKHHNQSIGFLARNSRIDTETTTAIILIYFIILRFRFRLAKWTSNTRWSTIPQTSELFNTKIVTRLVRLGHRYQAYSSV